MLRTFKALSCWLLLLALGSSAAQQVAASEFLGVRHFSVTDFARGLGTSATGFGNSVVVRTDFGILTLFTGERDYLWLPEGGTEPREYRAAVPVTEAAGHVWATMEILDTMGATVSGVVVVLPDRSRLVLTGNLPAGGAAAASLPPFQRAPADSGSEVIELANGVRALRMTQGEYSLLLVDLGLLGLAFPEQRGELDAISAGLAGRRPLYFVLSADSPAPAVLSFSVLQPGMNARLEPPDSVVIVQGSQLELAPGSPVSGVVLLPAATNLRGPLRVEWQQVTAEMIFRR